MSDQPKAPQKRIQATTFTPTTAVASRRKLQVKPLHLVIAALFLVVLVIGWFLVAAKSIIVTTAPIDAEVAVSGGLSFRIGDNFLLLPGDYTLTAVHELYYPKQQALVVNREDLQTVTVSLTPLPGSLVVATNPAAAANVYLDGELLGDNQSPLADIAAGPHSYQIVTERYQDVTGELEIIGLKQQQTLAVELTPAWAEITLASEPSGAEIVLDDEVLGVTPATVEILAGDKELTLQMAGFKPKLYPLTIEPQVAQDLGVIQLDKIDGLLAINSKPSGASVTINGQYVGQTPIEAPVEPGRGLSLYLFKDGYQSAARSVDVASGKTTQVAVDLQVLLGQVTIKAAPEDALLYVDGRLSGRANQTLNLPARQHQVKISRDGYVDFTTTILPRPGLAQYLRPDLKTIEQAKWEKVKPEITTSLGQKLRLFRPKGEFEMGSSRREQGRRSNEVLRKVELSRAFYMATTETTNGQFHQFLAAHTSSHVGGNSLNNDPNPVVNLSWLQAAQFCNWLSAKEGLPLFYEIDGDELKGFNPQATGYRLPTEAEWAWSARYADGEMLKYSWGPTLPPPAGAANIGDRNAAALLGTIQADYDDGYVVTAPVASFKANQHGLYDMNGNAAEWIHDFYLIKTGLSRQAELDPLGPAEGDYHVIRGASWASGGITDLRLSYRDYGKDAKNSVGFRIARYVE
ncbi:PEGA domain-containing protein [Halioxenophilus sp. WMMB6]|uniref:PEGA domain-containing protein n=1 Tax=Halioxenophilus sp. WMMB6 TaxID=3073815 RepID=UPI00295E3122|nr:PEGA domain-containing protein [Halioxenophilus sp. WMMB6]